MTAILETLSQEGKRALLEIARRSIQKGDEDSFQSRASDPYLGQYQAVFVTLTKAGQLRGCIGHTTPRWPLAEAVSRMAFSAAYNDSRFPPVDPVEIPDLEIEVSILSPFEEVREIEEICVGEDGLVVEKDGYRGLLLPQVAASRGWDRLQFLSHTCKKAGLGEEAWNDPETRIYRFQAYVFGEQDD